jgi:hypothetical protein
MYLPLALHRSMCDVTYIELYNTYLHGRFFFFLSALYNSISCLTSPQSTLLFVSNMCTRVCHFSKQFTTHRPTSHFLQKYSALRICFCSEHARHRHCFPLEGRCCECFTSSPRSWDANGLGLPFEMALAVTASSTFR